MNLREIAICNPLMVRTAQNHASAPRQSRLLSALLLMAAVFAAGCSRNYEYAGEAFVEPVAVPDVTLESVDGPISLQDFAGQYTFVYFGYTFCPDICPATLARLKSVKEDLAEDAEEIAVVMVTVDPERDTPEKLAEYMAFFDKSFVGLSGVQADIDALATPFGLFYEKHEGTAESGYLVDHTAWFYLLDRESNLIVAYSHETEAEAVLNDLRHLLRQEN